MAMEIRRISTSEVAERTGLSHGFIESILHDQLHMYKICARWIPKMLTAEMKATRVATSASFLTRYNQNPFNQDFRFGLVTCGETWLSYYDPKSKQESME